MTFKKLQTFTAILFGALLVTMSCDENSNLPAPVNGASALQGRAGNPGARLTNYTFDGTEGGAITLDVATRWISNYTNQNLGKLTAHFFGRNHLEKMLATDGSMGIRFYYSLDDAGNPIVFATGADGKGNDFVSTYKTHGRNSSVALKVGPSLTSLLTQTDADSTVITTCNRWKDNYIAKNPGGIQAHFLGLEIIKQILSAKGCVGIRCYYAINDSGVQQLLLIGVTIDGQNILPLSTLGGRTEEDGTIGDMNLPCPSFCSGSSS
ncbi:MAG TPA: hypothetical protein VL728_04545 [Cyclobacteriaceae bacterium]|nr:hypothetical protein [Cyclobacteriaceae bacterium]